MKLFPLRKYSQSYLATTTRKQSLPQTKGWSISELQHSLWWHTRCLLLLRRIAGRLAGKPQIDYKPTLNRRGGNMYRRFEGKDMELDQKADGEKKQTVVFSRINIFTFVCMPRQNGNEIRYERWDLAFQNSAVSGYGVFFVYISVVVLRYN